MLLAGGGAPSPPPRKTRGRPQSLPDWGSAFYIYYQCGYRDAIIPMVCGHYYIVQNIFARAAHVKPQHMGIPAASLDVRGGRDRAQFDVRLAHPFQHRSGAFCRRACADYRTQAPRKSELGRLPFATLDAGHSLFYGGHLSAQRLLRGVFFVAPILPKARLGRDTSCVYLTATAQTILR